MSTSRPTPHGASHPGAQRGIVHLVDLGIAIAVIVVCVWLYYETTLFDEVPPFLGENIGPEFFPRLLLWLIGALALAMPFEHRVMPGAAERLAKGRERPIGGMAWGSLAVLVVIVASMPILGVSLSMVLACFALPLLWGERRWHLLIPFAIFFPTLITLVFAKVLKVFFHPGLIGFTLI